MWPSGFLAAWLTTLLAACDRLDLRPPRVMWDCLLKGKMGVLEVKGSRKVNEEPRPAGREERGAAEAGAWAAIRSAVGVSLKMEEGRAEVLGVTASAVVSKSGSGCGDWGVWDEGWKSLEVELSLEVDDLDWGENVEGSRFGWNWNAPGSSSRGRGMARWKVWTSQSFAENERWFGRGGVEMLTLGSGALWPSDWYHARRWEG